MFDIGEALQGALYDALDVVLGHRLADLPVNEGSAVAVEDSAEVVEGAANIAVGHVDVPVFMRLQRLNEAGAFERFRLWPAGDAVGFLEEAVDSRRCDRHHIGIEHHEGQSVVSFEWELAV